MVFCSIPLVACMAPHIELRVSNNFVFKNLQGLDVVTKSGDFIAFSNKDGKRFVISENFGHASDFSSTCGVSPMIFFAAVFDENTKNDVLRECLSTNIIIEENYINKKKLQNKDLTVYIWRTSKETFISKVLDNHSNDWIDILGKRVDPVVVESLLDSGERISVSAKVTDDRL